MSQNLDQLNSTAIEIPHGWQPPKFQLGQPVVVHCEGADDQLEIEFGLIVGFSYLPPVVSPAGKIGCGWSYDVALSPDSPRWKVYSGILVAQADEIFPAGLSDLAHPPLMPTSAKSCELVLK